MQSDIEFRAPPDYVTMPCLTYMARVMELRDFTGIFFHVIKSQETLIASLRSHGIDTTDQSGEYTRYDFSDHRQIVNEIMLSRAVESLEYYISNILKQIFFSRPEVLKSEAAIDLATLIELRDFDNIVDHIADKKVHELMYKPLKELRSYIFQKTGLHLFSDEAVFEKTLVATELRNLIAHNDCAMNKYFQRRTHGIEHGLTTGIMGRIPIADEWLRTASYTIDSVVFDFDEAASEKFEISKLNRFTSFMMRNPLSGPSS